MLELLMSMSTSAILVFDETGNVLLSNSAATDMLGYSEVEFKKLRLRSLIPQEYVKKHANLFKAFINSNETLRKMGEYREVSARRKDGVVVPVHASIGQANLDGRKTLVAVLRDLTAEKKAEENIRSLALLPQENPNPVLRINATGEILYANTSAINFLKDIGIPEADHAHPAWQGYLAETLQSGSQMTRFIRHGERIYSCVFAPVSEMAYINLYALDVTEREIEKSRLDLSDNILNSIGNLVLVANSNAEIIYVSPSVQKIIGYTPEEILGGGWWEMERISGGDVEAEKEYIRNAASGKTHVDGTPYEHRVRHKDGSWRWLMLADTKGPNDMLIGIGTDITNIKQAEEELVRQNEFAQMLMEQMGQGLTVTNKDGQFTFVNPSYAKMLGYEPEELLGKTPFDVTFQEDHITLHNAQMTRASGQINSYETRLRRKNGEEAYTLITGSPRVKNGEFEGAVTVITDLTERMQMEKNLRESEGFIRALYDIVAAKDSFEQKVHGLLELGTQRFSLPIGIFSKITGEDYTVVETISTDLSIHTGAVFELHDTYCVETIHSLVPISFRQAKGSNWAVHPCYQSFKLESYLGMPVYRGGQIYGTLNFSSTTPLTKDISEADKNILKVMAQWIGDELDRLYAAEQLRTYAEEINKNNIELSEARDNALEAAYLKGAFLATMSHEIRTPMNAIMGMNELLLDTELNAEQREFAETIETSTRNLLAILNDILDFSKIEAGKLSIIPSPFKPDTLVRETVKLFMPKAQQKSILLSVMVTSNIPDAAMGDSGRIRQILSNLISNAIKFTPEGGLVFVNLSGTQINEENLIVTFTVQDTGQGISESMKKKLFEPFTQADASHTRKHGGTGLGLAISKRLVDLMHGEIGFDSMEGTGSTFWFSLPLGTNIPKHPKIKKAPEARWKDFSNQRPILIVEDNLVNRDLLSMQLREFGITSRHAGNGREAVELLQVDPDAFSLVLMDLNMPDMDGLTAARKIREHEKVNQKHTIIVAVTANAMQGIKDSCLQAGMNDFINKPVSLKDIENLLSKWLN
ncbi:MAG: PAS domain S-box protein [Anaerolineales bacterium]|uniref:PAS domain S-box protein n=1 Tax=Candidatus Villigracilis vicinus TaxID=3140679 RepID=UPI003136545B|nr:PAS domain S-box protein [Anaerolineales bacterium]